MCEPQVSELKRSQFLLVASHGHEHAVSLALRQSQHRGDTFNVRLYTARKKLESLVKECGSQCHFQFLVANHEQCFNDWSSKTWKLDGDLRGGGERHGDPFFGVVSLSSVFHSGKPETGRKRAFGSILAFLGRSPADWAAEAAGFLLCLPSEGHSPSSLAVPLQCGWDHSAHPSPMVMRRPLPRPPPHSASLCVVACHISLPAGSPMLTGRAWAWVTINISLLPFTCLTRPAASLCQSGFCFSSESWYMLSFLTSIFT